MVHSTPVNAHSPASTSPAAEYELPELFFNPFDPGFRVDPYSVYERLRIEDPRHRSPLGSLVLSRYDDCSTLLRHPAVSSDYSPFADAVTGPATVRDESELGLARPFLFTDPPDHTRLRGLVAKAFTPRVVERQRVRVQELVDELLDAVVAQGGMDVIEDFAYPVPLRIIAELLGVPPADHDVFRGWSREMARSLDPDFVLAPDVIERRENAALEFAEYFRNLIDERRKSPRDDLLSGLVAAEDEGDKLTEAELLSTLILLLVAGHETTVNLIGNGILALARHSDQLELLRSDPSLARAAVEELLRYDPPVQMTVRTAVSDIDVAGTTLAAGEQAIILLASANRDPAAFHEPERLDLQRPQNHHLAFGFGIHHCLGAPLARIEGQIALATLARRVPGLRLAIDAPEYKENIVLRGLATLPVEW
jgi:cytochrome P450